MHGKHDGKPVSYRARKACREEYKELRARLGRLKDTEWQQAGRIMGQNVVAFTTFLGNLTN